MKPEAERLSAITDVPKVADNQNGRFGKEVVEISEKSAKRTRSTGSKKFIDTQYCSNYSGHMEEDKAVWTPKRAEKNGGRFKFLWGVPVPLEMRAVS